MKRGLCQWLKKYHPQKQVPEKPPKRAVPKFNFSAKTSNSAG
jgi:hypothetical protein